VIWNEWGPSPSFGMAEGSGILVSRVRRGVGCSLWWEVSGGHLVVNGDLLVGGMAWPGLEFPSLGKDKEGPEVFCARGTCSRVSIWRGSWGQLASTWKIQEELPKQRSNGKWGSGVRHEPWDGLWGSGGVRLILAMKGQIT